MTLSNLYESERGSLRSFGICGEKPYADAIVARHRQEEAAAMRRVAEINAILSQRAEAI